MSSSRWPLENRYHHHQGPQKSVAVLRYHLFFSFERVNAYNHQRRRQKSDGYRYQKHDYRSRPTDHPWIQTVDDECQCALTRFPFHSHHQSSSSSSTRLFIPFLHSRISISRFLFPLESPLTDLQGQSGRNQVVKISLPAAAAGLASMPRKLFRAGLFIRHHHHRHTVANFFATSSKPVEICASSSRAGARAS